MLNLYGGGSVWLSQDSQVTFLNMSEYAAAWISVHVVVWVLVQHIFNLFSSHLLAQWCGFGHSLKQRVKSLLEPSSAGQEQAQS